MPAGESEDIYYSVLVRTALVITAASVFLSGCTVGQPGPDPVQAQIESTPEAMEEQSVPNPPLQQQPESEALETEQQPADVEPPAVEFVVCGETVKAAIASTISSQTESFAVGDFKLAYSYASPSFRAAVGLESFIGIIQGSYGPLISSSTLSFVNCVVGVTEELAAIDVRFTEAGSEVYALRYVMVNTDSGWRVDGASALASLGSGI